jgi:hypothetical protein
MSGDQNWPVGWLAPHPGIHHLVCGSPRPVASVTGSSSRKSQVIVKHCGISRHRRRLPPGGPVSQSPIVRIDRI